MHDKYLCPECKSVLNTEDEIVLVFQQTDDIGGIIKLKSELGNYEINNLSNYKFKKGEFINLACPVCHSRLKALTDKNLAFLLLKTQHADYNIYFSKIFGEECTFVQKEKEIESYGDHTSHYLDFFSNL